MIKIKEEKKGLSGSLLFLLAFILFNFFLLIKILIDSLYTNDNLSIIIGFIYLLVIVLLLILFFKKSKIFPKMFKTLIIINMVIGIIFGLYYIALVEEPITSIIPMIAIFWILIKYINNSERVHNTFVN
jgi:chromate transport protein ChrA